MKIVTVNSEFNCVAYHFPSNYCAVGAHWKTSVVCALQTVQWGEVQSMRVADRDGTRFSVLMKEINHRSESECHPGQCGLVNHFLLASSSSSSSSSSIESSHAIRIFKTNSLLLPEYKTRKTLKEYQATRAHVNVISDDVHFGVTLRKPLSMGSRCWAGCAARATTSSFATADRKFSISYNSSVLNVFQPLIEGSTVE